MSKLRSGCRVEGLLRAALVALVALSAGCSVSDFFADPGAAPQGVAAGDVRATSAVLWVRCVGSTDVGLVVDGGATSLRRSVDPSRESDWTASVRLADLRPDTTYAYRFGCGRGVQGTFRTAPPKDARRPVKIAWGGDIGGQNVCRDETDGYSVFAAIGATRPEVFIGLGDMIYADNECEAVGRYGNRQVVGPAPALELSDFERHWRYNRADRHHRALLAAVPYVGIWDDHEIRNDSGPREESADGVRLLPPALASFLAYHPIDSGEYGRLYRSLRWGRHLEMFVLDTRQYRDRNDAVDGPERVKSLLGTEQRTWLLEALDRSDATWRIVVSSVPLSIPTGRGDQARDGWANFNGVTGFESEAALILRHAYDHGMRNLIWITTDVHFATGFLYRPIGEDRDFAVHEFVSGPMNAGVFPHEKLDQTFRPERLFFWGPKKPIKSYAEALSWFNFGLLEVDAEGDLTVSIVNARGVVVAEHSLPAPASR